jgi:prepilin-type N-terminal cleavage/methylation domain-containing protein
MVDVGECKMQNSKSKMEICTFKYAINQRGFTLVELLIAMALASVVGMAGVSLFSTSNWAYKVNEDVAEAQQNVRVSMERIAKDIRVAGFGLPDPPFTISIGGQNWTSPITVTTSGGSGGSDSITILGIGYEAGTLTQGAATDCNVGATSKICLDSVASANNFFSTDLTTFMTSRKYVSLNGSTFIELSNTQTERADKKLTLGTPSTLGRTYPDGTPVYIIQAVQYTINDAAPFLAGCSASNPCLASLDFTGLRGGTGNDRQVFAQNIEDIQFAYGVDADRDGRMDSSILSNDPADDSSIVAVRTTVVAKTSTKDMKGSTFTRSAIEDHSASAPDNYRRRALTKIIKLRNPRTGG